MSRKQEILDIAFELFEKKGYDTVSTNDIVKEVGIARGTLYHHFKSKEDILDSIIEQFCQKSFDRARQIAQDSSIPVTQRLAQVIASLNAQDNQLFDYIHQPQNALMHEKISHSILSELPSILLRVIQDGIELGMMETPYPYEACELIVAYVNGVIDNHALGSSQTNQKRRMESFIYHLELLFKAPKGTFDFILDLSQH
ncbi:TetR/AcrR family transcriptional regulator [Facklamia sp. DSM 111018]|uniref:TetR/AcrR family transcriptional regulator n=1 Tax=Facklamia lactis TaxID=2749967 RepID=A0ABS0LMS2_9LACT|nr:TetR/AcrR family transcriptional regulator [Facklamia lactis]MBG9979862.1 TetR/AcrR family transcriptional regulator [Facklamia lactis]MBG9985458.1 TetR/AcrR family transcriptional regulator [Facklamia lactis]